MHFGVGMAQSSMPVVSGGAPAVLPFVPVVSGGAPTVWTVPLHIDDQFLCMKRLDYCAPRVRQLKTHSAYELPGEIVDENRNFIQTMTGSVRTNIGI